jgi:hypothetical protein
MISQVRQIMQWACGAAVGGAIATTAMLTAAEPAQAQAAYGSYVGLGASFGLTDDAATGQGNSFSGVVAGRYRFLEVPVSIRAQAFFGGGGFAFVPTVSYDYSSIGIPTFTWGQGFPLRVAIRPHPSVTKRPLCSSPVWTTCSPTATWFCLATRSSPSEPTETAGIRPSPSRAALAISSKA